MDVHIAVVGLGFGSAFAPIYRRHPRVRAVTLVDRDQALARGGAGRFGGGRIAPSLEAVLADDDVDAVHLATPVPDHARQAIAVLAAG